MSASSITTPRGILRKGDSIFHVGKDDVGRISIEELIVVGFKYGRLDTIVFDRKPSLQSLSQFYCTVDKQEIKTNQVSDECSRCWFFYKRSSAIKRIKKHLDKEQAALDLRLNALADQYNQLASLEIIP